MEKEERINQDNKYAFVFGGKRGGREAQVRTLLLALSPSYAVFTAYVLLSIIFLHTAPCVTLCHIVCVLRCCFDAKQHSQPGQDNAAPNIAQVYAPLL